MKKKVIVAVSVLAVLGIGFIVISNLLGGSKEKVAKSAQGVAGEDYGIDYFEVPDIEQVYINGVVQPDQMEAFAKDSKITSTPEIKVNNGDIVEPDTELFTYEDKEVTKELETQNSNLSKQYTKKENIYAKWKRAVDNFNKIKEENRTTSKAAIDEQHQGEIDAVDEEILFINQTITSLTAKQFISTKAKFKGRVSIPEVKDANAPILRLTSEGLYVAGKVNEKDLMKISVEQKANLSVVSTGKIVTGKISYIDDNPPGGGQGTQSSGDSSSSAATMSSYNVKLSLDSLEGIKNGYHMQATVNIGESKPIEIPTAAIKEQDGKKYVLVNDFGSVIRRDIQTGEVVGDKTTIHFGLESADRIIVSSKKEVKEGDRIEEASKKAGEPAPAG